MANCQALSKHSSKTRRNFLFRADTLTHTGKGRHTEEKNVFLPFFRKKAIELESVGCESDLGGTIKFSRHLLYQFQRRRCRDGKGHGQSRDQSHGPSAESTGTTFLSLAGVFRPLRTLPNPLPQSRSLTASKVVLHQASVALVVTLPLV